MKEVMGPITELIREWVLLHAEVEIIGDTDQLGMFAKVPDVHQALKSVSTIYPDGRRMILIWLDGIGEVEEISLHNIEPCGILKTDKSPNHYFYSMLWFPDPEVMELEWAEIRQRYEDYWLTNGQTE